MIFHEPDFGINRLSETVTRADRATLPVVKWSDISFTVLSVYKTEMATLHHSHMQAQKHTHQSTCINTKERDKEEN